jgi:hypothetical protein
MSDKVLAHIERWSLQVWTSLSPIKYKEKLEESVDSFIRKGFGDDRDEILSVAELVTLYNNMFLFIWCSQKDIW